jgi:hypothetical protein
MKLTPQPKASRPYRGVRGTGVATLHDDRGEDILRVLIERYLG